MHCQPSCRRSFRAIDNILLNRFHFLNNRAHVKTATTSYSSGFVEKDIEQVEAYFKAFRVCEQEQNNLEFVKEGNYNPHRTQFDYSKFT